MSERRLPYRLRLKASKAGVTAEELIADAVERNPTLTEAADELEVHPETLRRWRGLVGSK